MLCYPIPKLSQSFPRFWKKFFCFGLGRLLILKLLCSFSWLLHVGIAFRYQVLWGKANADSAEQVDRVSKALDALETTFLQMVKTGTTATGQPFVAGFDEDFLSSRRAALEDYATWRT